MAEYRAYAIDRDGHIEKSAPIVCDGDDEAIIQARNVLGGTTIEIWSGSRFVIRLDPVR